jgi:hypothetical protein
MAVLSEDEAIGSRPPEGHALGSQTALFDKFRELTRNGYVPDSRETEAGAAIVLRHASAPDLLLRPDGSIDIPKGQSMKVQPEAKPRMSKLRTLVVILLAAGLWFLSLAITATFMEV